DDEVDLVDIQPICVDARDRSRVGLVVVEVELDRAAEEAAFRILVLGPDLHRQEARLAVEGERAGQRHREADRDRLAGRFGGKRRRSRQHQGRDKARNASADVHESSPVNGYQPVGRATSSSARPRASGPTVVTAIAAMMTEIAIAMKTADTPYAFITIRMPGMMKALA